MNFAQMLGQSTFGLLSDKLRLSTLLLLSTIIAAIVTFTCWGIAHDLVPLIVGALLFSFFAYGVCSLRARIGTAIGDEPTAALATFGVLVLWEGLGTS